MKIFTETNRLFLREILPSDDEGMFALDSNKEVHRFLGNNPIENIEQARQNIALIRKQYIENGIGRWAVINKASNEFMGWAGFKLVKEKTNNHQDYYDLGYRFIQKFWGQGFASEAAKAALEYGFSPPAGGLGLTVIYATANNQNIASRKVLEKTGLKYIETFDRNGSPTDWFKIVRPDT